MKTGQIYTIVSCVLLILCLSANTISAQEDAVREVSLRVGLTHTSIQDFRMGSVRHKSWSPKYDIGYSQQNEKRISQVRLQFFASKSANQGLLSLTSLRPAINYSYQRKVGEGLWVGGFIDHSTLLNIPKTTTSLYNNNPISYNISQSIGPRITYTGTANLGEGLPLGYQVSTQAALLSYMIQPAFGHPYPTQYLNEEDFSPTREGMTWPLMKSGKLATLDKVRNFRLELGLFYFVNDRVKISLDYQGEIFYANTRGKALNMQSHDIFFGASYIH